MNVLLKSLLVGAFALTVSACGSSSSGSAPMKDLADCYAEIADNGNKVSEAYQAVYKADRSEQETMMQKAQAVAAETKIANEKLALKAKECGDALQGKTIECEATPEAGITAQAATFEVVEAGDRFANIVIRIPYTGTFAGSPRFELVDKDGASVYSSTPMINADNISCNFRITAESAKNLSKATKLVILTGGSGKSGAAEYAGEEPTFQGLDEGSESASAGGVKIEKGANLVSVLKSLTKVTYDYNADSGIWANTGNVSIVIDEDDLNEKGLEVINAITSDMADNIPLSPNCFKATAKITHIEAQ